MQEYHVELEQIGDVLAGDIVGSLQLDLGLEQLPGVVGICEQLFTSLAQWYSGSWTLVILVW